MKTGRLKLENWDFGRKLEGLKNWGFGRKLEGLKNWGFGRKLEGWRIGTLEESWKVIFSSLPIKKGCINELRAIDIPLVFCFPLIPAL